jgi:hypothetical protein
VRAEVVSPRIPAPGEVHGIEERSAETVGEAVRLSVRARTDVLITGTHYEAVGDVRSSEEDGEPAHGSAVPP